MEVIGSRDRYFRSMCEHVKPKMSGFCEGVDQSAKFIQIGVNRIRLLNAAANLLFGQFFSENCMKWKKMGFPCIPHLNLRPPGSFQEIDECHAHNFVLSHCKKTQ